LAALGTRAEAGIANSLEMTGLFFGIYFNANYRMGFRILRLPQ
jgi:hypothetical protein